MEATGYSRWFERLLAELGFEVWIGDAAEIKTKRVWREGAEKSVGITEEDFKSMGLRKLTWQEYGAVLSWEMKRARDSSRELGATRSHCRARPRLLQFRACSGACAPGLRFRFFSLCPVTRCSRSS